MKQKQFFVRSFASLNIVVVYLDKLAAREFIITAYVKELLNRLLVTTFKL